MSRFPGIHVSDASSHASMQNSLPARRGVRSDFDAPYFQPKQFNGNVPFAQPNMYMQQPVPGWSQVPTAGSPCMPQQMPVMMVGHPQMGPLHRSQSSPSYGSGNHDVDMGFMAPSPFPMERGQSASSMGSAMSQLPFTPPGTPPGTPRSLAELDGTFLQRPVSECSSPMQRMFEEPHYDVPDMPDGFRTHHLESGVYTSTPTSRAPTTPGLDANFGPPPFFGHMVMMQPLSRDSSCASAASRTPLSRPRPSNQKVLTGKGSSEWLEDAVENAKLMAAIEQGQDVDDDIWNDILDDALEASLSKNRCFIVQALLEVVDIERFDLLKSALEPHIRQLYESPNGNHVLCKIIEMAPCDCLDNILMTLEHEEGWVYMANHKYGGRVLERLIAHCAEEKIERMLNALTENALTLARHKNGNYIIRTMLETCSEDRKDLLLNQLLGHIGELGMTRMGSPVVQRAMRYCRMERQRAIVEALVRSTAPTFAEMAASRYGSYVVEALPECHFPGMVDAIQEARGRLAQATGEQRSSPFFPRAELVISKVVTGSSSRE